MSNFYVEIVETATGHVEKKMGPFEIRKAEKVERGAEINLDSFNYFVRIVEG